jgi:hypothetical protein
MLVDTDPARTGALDVSKVRFRHLVAVFVAEDGTIIGRLEGNLGPGGIM